MSREVIGKLLVLPGLFILGSLSLFSQTWILQWNDEFEGNGNLDLSMWKPDPGTAGGTIPELQYYTEEGNYALKEGCLVITAREESVHGKAYTSARLVTKGAGQWQYGKIIARMKMPSGQGTWPALWMLGNNIDQVNWPACGEIDILEYRGGIGREHIAHGTAHWAGRGNKRAMKGNEMELQSGKFPDGFYEFSIEWDPRRILWMVNDTVYHKLNIRSKKMSAFHQPFFLIVNLAIGGSWPGSPDESSLFPAEFWVDYVRVYRRE